MWAWHQNIKLRIWQNINKLAKINSLLRVSCKKPLKTVGQKVVFHWFEYCWKVYAKIRNFQQRSEEARSSNSHGNETGGRKWSSNVPVSAYQEALVRLAKRPHHLLMLFVNGDFFKRAIRSHKAKIKSIQSPPMCDNMPLQQMQTCSKNENM